MDSHLKSFGEVVAGFGKQEPEFCSVVHLGESQRFAQLRAFWVPSVSKEALQSVPSGRPYSLPLECNRPETVQRQWLRSKRKIFAVAQHHFKTTFPPPLSVTHEN